MQELEGLFEIPTPIENLQLPCPELLSFYKDVQNRSIWISDIGDNIVEFIKLIMQWNKEDVGKKVEDRQKIILYIYSLGGDADACFSFISLIKLSKTPIYTVNMGVAASAGALIFLAGHKKLAVDGSYLLLHLGSSSISGTATQVLDASEAYGKLLEKMRAYVLENTKIPKSLYSKMKKNEWTIDSNKFLEYGVADEVVSDIDSILA